VARSQNNANDGFDGIGVDTIMRIINMRLLGLLDWRFNRRKYGRSSDGDRVNRKSIAA